MKSSIAIYIFLPGIVDSVGYPASLVLDDLASIQRIYVLC